ncbi:MutS-related protein [Pseudobacter ginsenosidimutans]|uniref:MutS-like protein n=1 Tax=Pseudobacter ginsenosidimutans TaxID=661488 RepID=A0A4Q7MS37_9BACT|nr:DNA mismatch repair protein [Pseudobacter ginsenosidimutans]QEC42425.1 DNA mismatch repair protein [Pseudobacter ginsenosidimutans]RZS70724.1 MutS-like protein [Pseudobacter ginsenosidimutans]
MRLQTDEQTIEDLRIFSKKDSPGIYDIYNQTHTRGGEAALQEMFRHPLGSRELINKRSSVIEQFAGSGARFPYSASLFDMAEKYLAHAGEQETRSPNGAAFGEKEIHNGVGAVIELIRGTHSFLFSKELGTVKDYSDEKGEILMLLTDPAFEPALKDHSKGKLSYATVTAFDTLFRVREYAKIKKLLGYIFRLDVYLSVAEVANKRNFVFPKAHEKGNYELEITGLYHPELKNPVSNDISLNAVSPVLFLTGANMAGKSTFLRSLSTAVYIAHMGFPVAARSMQFPVMDGIYTTINLPDNLGIGASHFYAEVLRVKKMAEELHSGKCLFIIFDELFRGTNVKDAHEATVTVTNGFSQKRNSLFVISSHIVEAGEQLMQNPKIGVRYLPTRMNGHTPEYTYKLENGITEDRHGMIIINNEGILEILKNGMKKKAKHVLSNTKHSLA